MKKINKWSCFVLIFLSFNISSCRKFLEVNPRDAQFEEEAFSTKEGMQSVLNGVYLQLSHKDSYGAALSITTMDLLGQLGWRYDLDANNSLVTTASINNYYDKSSRAAFAGIWKQAYKGILQANNFIKVVENANYHVLASDERNVVLGEVYGLRAMLHFDMLRIFGPIYLTNPDGTAIPYFDAVSHDPQPLLKGSEVVNKLLHDIDQALKLLEKDPIRKGSVTGEGLLFPRNTRMNYYAVKTLQARVLLYAGRKTEAWEAINSVLGPLEYPFPWDGSTAKLVNNPTFANEGIFCINNRELYNIYRDYFSPFLDDVRIVRPSENNLNSIYPSATDLRLSTWFKLGTEANKQYKVFAKYSDGSVNSTLRYIQPLIRKSELYLIAAEANPDIQDGYRLLNILKQQRGLPAIASTNSTSTLLDEIRNEYVRELWGDGQIFYLYKRLNISRIGPGGLMMNDKRYQVLLPEDESFYR